MTRILLATFTLCALVFGQSEPRPKPAVWAVLKDRCQVRGLELELGDIAEVGSTDPALARRAERLSLGATPEPGRRLRLTRASVAELLTASGNDVTLRGARATEIQSETITLGSSRVATLARRHFRAKLGEDLASTRLMPSRLPAALVSRAGRYRLSYRASIRPEAPLAGSVPIEVEALVDGRPTASTKVWLVAHRRGPVLVANRNLAAGQRLQQSDLRLEVRESTSAGNRTLSGLESAVGRITSRRIGSGEVLARSDVKEPPVVFRGDELRLIARSGALTVKTSGVAMNDGAPGDRIKVRTGKRRRVVDATIVDSKTARMTINPTKGDQP